MEQGNPFQAVHMKQSGCGDVKPEMRINKEIAIAKGKFMLAHGSLTLL